MPPSDHRPAAPAERAGFGAAAAPILGLLAPVVPSAAGALCVARRLPDARGILLSFDDGPHPEGTPAVLEALATEEVRAAFFLVGEQAERRPELVRRIAEAGHLVALHGYRHRLQPRLRGAEVEADMRRGGAALAEALGMPPLWHRPPYGIYSRAGLMTAEALGMRPLLWSRWGKDWRKFTTPERIAARATRDIGPGDVILLHDADFYSARGSHHRTVRALPMIISRLKRRGLDTVLPV